MTRLDRRDRRRALTLVEDWTGSPAHPEGHTLARLIAAALKREREETGFAAIGYLFSGRAQGRAKKAFERAHGPVKKGKR